MRDFTLKVYAKLLHSLRRADYVPTSFEQYVLGPPSRAVVLRHDVDRRPARALAMARLEHDEGIRASYYFRAVPESWHPEIVRQIVALGHELGYHYEDLTLARGDAALAIHLFQTHLERFREEYPVQTICMHGSPLSRWDNRDLWQHCTYQDFGILAEPYLDLDFSKIAYLTDTGRARNNQRYSRRDHVGSDLAPSFESTNALVDWIKARQAPDHLMINTHPERWTDSLAGWGTEVLVQTLKRPVKAAYIAIIRR